MSHFQLMTTRTGAVAFALAAAVLCISPCSASGQDALGSGNALDANLSTRTRTNAPSTRVDYRSRNLLVTNDVAGGRGFRGAVGYEAAGDFSGRLGSNDLFSFRADSAYSDASLLRYGNAYTQMRLGAAAGGPLEYRRFGAAPSVIDVDRAGSVRAFEYAPDSEARSMLDRISAERLQTSQTLAAAPQPVGMVYDEQGRASVLESSSLRGLSLRPFGEEPAATGLLERAAAGAGQRDEEAKRRSSVTQPFESLRLELRDEVGGAEDSQRIERTEDDRRVDTAADRAYDGYTRILQRVVDRYAGMQDIDVRVDRELLRRLGVEYDQLRESLVPEAPTRRTTMADDPRMQDPFNTTPGEPDPRQDDDPTRTTDLVRPGAQDRGAGLEQFGVVLRHGEVIESLTGEEQDRFNEIMAEGERFLRVGEYFRAERTFERALRMVRGHPLATAGYAHAQLGAGLYRSAHYTLRSLYTAHPAMIDARYQTGLIPNRVRLLNAVAVLDERLRDEDFDRALNGFLLAFIGHQIEDQAMVARGLEAMAGEKPDDPLLPLLQAVWLAEDDADDAPADADDAADADDDGEPGDGQ